MSLLELKVFIKNIEPFNYLSNEELEELSCRLDILYFKENITVMDEKSDPDFLYFIIKGVVQEKFEDEIVSGYSANEFFDPICLIESKVKHRFKTLQETICYALPKEVFLKIMYHNAQLERYFFSSISDKLNTSNQTKVKNKLLDFAMSKVEDAYLQKPTFVDENETIHNTVKILVDKGIQAILVKGADGEVGIVTDSAFVKKVALNRMDLDLPVKQITTYGLKTIDAGDFLFNAQLEMAKHNLKRLLVKKDGKIIGLLDIVSLSSHFASHTHSTSKQIEESQNIEQLKEASTKFIRTIRALYEKGVKVRYISKLISALNHKLFNKLFQLTAPKDLLENSALLIMGSEGRGEQILRTDQDNALILDNNIQIDQKVLEEFTQSFTRNLVDFGYPLCDGNIMVSNPFWVKTVDQYKDTVFEWIHKPSEENFMNLAIFYDAVCVSGKGELLDEVKDHIFNIASQSDSFNSFFAKPTLMFETPLGFFSDFVVDTDKHKDELDIKKGGIFPLVHGVRSLAMQKHIKETGTVKRVKALNNMEVLDDELAREIVEAFNFLLQLRLKFRLEKIDARIELDNYISPDKLSTLEKDLLKDSFKIVNKFKKFVTYHYKLNMI
jgi:CBS domain-containing protein